MQHNYQLHSLTLQKEDLTIKNISEQLFFQKFLGHLLLFGNDSIEDGYFWLLNRIKIMKCFLFVVGI